MQEFPDYRSAVVEIASKNKINLMDEAMRYHCLGVVHAQIQEGLIRLGVNSHEQDAGYKLADSIFLRDSFLNLLTENPDTLLEPGNFAHMAGGILPVIFGTEGHKVWEDLKRHAVRNEISFVGMQFSLPELVLIGRFARFLFESYRTPTCIDERALYHSKGHSHLVHCECGACKAVEKIVEWEDPLEDYLHMMFGEGKEKLPIQPGMSHHRTTVINVDFGSKTRTLNLNAQMDARFHDSLPFNVSFPVSLLKSFIEKYKLFHADAELLINGWAKFNVGAARGIIGGHNELSHLQNQTVALINMRGVKTNEIALLAQDAIRPFASYVRTLEDKKRARA